MTIKAPVRRKFSRSRPKPEPTPVYCATGPRELRFPHDQRVPLLVVFAGLGLLTAFGLWIQFWGPPKARVGGYFLLGFVPLFAAWIWMFAWRPMMAARKLFRDGHYAVAKVVRVHCPWWSQVLRAMRPFLLLASRAALVAEIAYRLTITVPDGAGGTRTLERVLWRTFSNSLPRHGQEVGVFYDPERSDRFVFVTDLKPMGIELTEV